MIETVGDSAEMVDGRPGEISTHGDHLRGAKNFSLYAKKFSCAMMVAVGIYFGITNI